MIQLQHFLCFNALITALRQKKRRISVRCEREKKHTVNYFCWNILSLALSFLTLWHFVASAISLPNMHGRWHTIAWIIQILVCPKPIFTIGNKLVEVDDTFKRIISCNLIRMRSHSFFFHFTAWVKSLFKMKIRAEFFFSLTNRQQFDWTHHEIKVHFIAVHEGLWSKQRKTHEWKNGSEWRGKRSKSH